MHGNVADRRALEREALRNVIAQWNANRLDLFELSEPNEELEFHGVMRFYFQDSGQKVATKCIRVASDATVEDVIGTLVEKFRPDMRMLSVPSYALYELHENGTERRLTPDEKPLLVQLNWHVDDREGRFLLKNTDEKTNQFPDGALQGSNISFRRKLSKREKKQLKKQEKLQRMKSENGSVGGGKDGVAEKLYSELPETSFTRSISNPEAVMRRRRRQKLEQKLQQFRSKDGGPDTGGTLKIYGEALCRDVPYKTLLLSIRDTAGSVVREMLDKYGLTKADPSQWCLVQVTSQTGANETEYVLDDDECPLAILISSPVNCSIMFHVRRRPADLAPRKRKKKPGVIGATTSSIREPRASDSAPILVELGPDGSTPHPHPSDNVNTFRLSGEVMEVGSANGIPLQLYGPHIQPRHAVITNTDDGIAITPCHADAHTYVNGQRIHQTTIISHGSLVKFGHSNSYRFLDLSAEGRQRRPSIVENNSMYDRSPRALSPTEPGRENFETTFDLEGNVETISTASGPREDSRSLGSTSEHRLAMDRYPRGQDPILPAVLEFPEDHQEQFLARVITHLDVTVPTFRLAPAYTLYLCARYRASTHYRPELTPTERAHKLTILLQHAAMLIRHTVQDRSTESGSQAFWLANASELLHFLKSDRHVSAFSLQAQDTLADAVQLSFRNLVACLVDELISVLGNLTSEIGDDQPRDVVGVLSVAMNLLRRCRVNAALTIQLFSQLFHFVSARTLSIIISNPALCNRTFGARLLNRLKNLQGWAESQGLELAAECHLAKIVQCAHLLQSSKSTAEELANLSANCFKLNSLQLRAILTQYNAEPGEHMASSQLIEQTVRAAEGVADELAQAEGREVRLHEDPTPSLQLLLPDDGFSCDVVQGVPSGLAEFLQPLQVSGLCRLAAQPTSSGHWTVYMNTPRPPSALSTTQPEVQVIRLHKSGGGMGLSIVAAKGAGQERLGIYIKSVVPGGAADRDGRLSAGDQLLSVDGQSLLGITQEKAAEFLVRTGSVVTLEVAKGGAVYHGLATLLQQPSPTPHRGPRRMSERDLPSRVDAERTMPSSKSVPALHHITSPGGSVEQMPRGPHDVFNPGYSRTSSNNSINTSVAPQNGTPSNTNNVVHAPPPAPLSANSVSTSIVSGPSQNLRSRSVHNLHQQDSGFYQNLSIYRNKMPSPQELIDRTSVLRSSQNSLQSSMANSQRPVSAYYHHQQQQQQQQQANNPVASRQQSHSIPNLKLVPSTYQTQHYSHHHHHHHHHQQQQPQQQISSNYSTHNFQNYPPPANYHGRPNVIKSQEDLTMMKQVGYRPEEMGKPPIDPRYVQGLLKEDTIQQPHMTNSKPHEVHGEMRLSKSDDILKTTSQNEIMRYASSGNVRTQESTVRQNEMLHRNDDKKDLIRSQAKLAEMSEEVRRRQNRMQQNAYHSQQMPQHSQPQQQQPQQPYYNQQGPVYSNYLNQMSQNTHNLQQLNLSPNYNPKSPPLAPKPPRRIDEPPELPPTSTHPLYSASMQDPPKMAFYPSGHNMSNSKGPARDPWTREEQERQAEIRREQGRVWQEQQIKELGSLPYRTQQQEEQLRVLQLEREFQRRALEAADQDDDDVEEKESPSPTPYVLQHPTTLSLSSPPPPPPVLATQTNRQNCMPLPTSPIIGNKQQELRTSILKPGIQGMAVTHQIQTSQPVVENEIPMPPERGSSFMVMSMHNKEGSKRVTFNDSSPPLTSTGNIQVIEETMMNIREDPNSFIRQAESMLASPTTPTDNLGGLMNVTPGVIGSQEVYKDPRTRRLAEQAQQQRSSVPVPEKLSFKEKMKMFAMETGEAGTPKDKSKISRAQREIDSIGSPPPPSSNLVH